MAEMERFGSICALREMAQIEEFTGACAGSCTRRRRVRQQIRISPAVFAKKKNHPFGWFFFLAEMERFELSRSF
ncbi:MAG: hypothetical protein K6C08_10975 [Oscillospiraceae bacterium]|nr:hypothetical protein [Oscillospiraceae bacterium]